MFLLNLSLAELLALAGSLSGLMVALYLLDRSRRKVLVATLRFWTSAEHPTESRRRRRIRQWPSLLLQILGILCLLAAVAEMHWGSREKGSRDHVLILDTSSWMSARTRQGTLMEQARRSALAYLKALPAGDRVMVVYADGLATPATAFESDRAAVEKAIRAARAGASALHLPQALDLARRVQERLGNLAGEIVYVGAGRIVSPDPASASSPPANLRVIPVPAVVENVGLRKIALRRSAVEGDLWNILVVARNYGTRARTVDLALQFGGAPAGSRRMSLQPGAEQEATLEYRTRAAGWLEARLLARDGFPDDDRAVVEIPRQTSQRVTVYTDQPELFRPLLAANRLVEASYRSPAEYAEPAASEVVILDRFAPPSPPRAHTVWISPPAERSPVPLGESRKDAALERWRSDHELGAGLRTQDLRLEEARTLAASSGDIPVAEIRQGPVIVARPAAGGSGPKQVVFGFHPLRSALRYELATPLLFANILRWMAPESFRRLELQAAAPGIVSVPWDTQPDPATVRVTTEDGLALPFTAHERSLRFFTASPGLVRIRGADRELVYSLTLPEVGEAVWDPPAGARRGVPAAVTRAATSRELWRLLALLGGLILLLEWLWYGQRDRVRRPGSMIFERIRARIPRWAPLPAGASVGAAGRLAARAVRIRKAS